MRTSTITPSRGHQNSPHPPVAAKLGSRSLPAHAGSDCDPLSARTGSSPRLVTSNTPVCPAVPPKRAEESPPPWWHEEKAAHTRGAQHLPSKLLLLLDARGGTALCAPQDRARAQAPTQHPVVNSGACRAHPNKGRAPGRAVQGLASDPRDCVVSPGPWATPDHWPTPALGDSRPSCRAGARPQPWKHPTPRRPTPHRLSGHLGRAGPGWAGLG